MPSNVEAAELFREIADLLDLLGERFKPEAYRRAARSIESLTEDLGSVAARGELRSIPGVGEAIEEKIREYLATGKVPYYERLRSEVPPGVLELMRLPGIGPKTARRFWVELGVEGPAELRDAIGAGRLTGVKGFGDRKIAQIRSVVETTPARPSGNRIPLEVAYSIARGLTEALRSRAPAQEVEVAGSFRRGRETVGDLDLLVTSDDPPTVFDVFSAIEGVREVRLRGGTKETVVLENGLQVDLRVVEPLAFGAALQYFTGSKDHNVRLRSLARDRGLKINEYGVFRGEERVAGRTEEEVYATLGLPWIPPELREDRGEIAAAAAGTLPHLVERADLEGDLHVHLDHDAGPDQIDRLVENARARTLHYLGLVISEFTRAGRSWTAPEELRRRLGRSDEAGVRLVPVVEGPSGPVPEEIRGLQPAFLILRPAPRARAAGPPASDGIPCRLVGHIGSGPEDLRPALELARSVGAAVEVGPGDGRLDSARARVARESGLALAIPAAPVSGPDDPIPDVALAFARRAGAVKGEVVNARPLERMIRPAPRNPKR